MGDPNKQWKISAATHNANRHLALFAKTGNGLLIWKAYQEFRKAGLSIPENILKKFDHYADRLLTDGDPNPLRALDLAFNEKGGAGPRADLKAKRRSRDIVELVRIHHESAGRPLSDAFRAVAKQFRTTPGAVKRLWYDWPKRWRRW